MRKYEVETLRTFIPTPLVKLLMNFLALRTCGSGGSLREESREGGL